MCGIVAILAVNQPLAREALHGATEALRHRGPDGATEWISPDGCMGLGHTRLGIVDPGAVQPLVSEDGRRRIVVNGEFYGFDRIRAELQGRGHRLSTSGDSEIALHLYEELGYRCLERLRGEFAFCLWDESKRTLFAARDRFGVKPLYYAQRGDAVLLASEAKALFAAGLPPAWDAEAAFQAMHGCYTPDFSLFRGVKQLPPGHFLHASPTSLRVEPYWKVDYPRAQDEADDEASCAEEVGALLREAVHLRMRADVPVGYLLSGGLDSSTMLGIGAAEAGTPVRAFSIGFSSDRYDESGDATAMARHAGARLTLLRVAEPDLAAAFADSVWHGEGIQYNAHATARFLLSRKISESGYRSVMGGEGADELFAGYGFVRAAAVNGGTASRLATIGALLRPPTAAERPVARASSLLARGLRLVDLPPWATTRAIQWLTHLRSVLSPEFVAEFEDHDPFKSALRTLDLRRSVLRRHPAKKILYVWLRTIFANYHMAADRIDMAHAVEVRLPYLDHLLFERVKQIPVAVLAKGGRQKHLLREIGHRHVTEAVYRGPKRPFYAPPTASAAGTEFHELMQETLRSATFAGIPFFDQQGALSLLDQLAELDDEDRATVDPILMMMGSMSVLHERFGL